MGYPHYVKSILMDKINELSQAPWLFTQNPSKDFTRSRKLDFGTMVRFMLAMESKNLKRELLEFFQYSSDTATVSAFHQQRGKILPEAFAFLFHEFEAAFPEERTYEGYRLLACDGSQLNFSRDPNDWEHYIHDSSGRMGHNQLHLNVLYDLCSRRYLDAVIQPGRGCNEYRAMADMVDRYHSQEKTIFLGDRGYESYNIFAHVEQKNMYYLIRVKDGTRGGMVGSLKLPPTDTFDTLVSFILTKRNTNEVKRNPGRFRYLQQVSPFDYFGPGEAQYYPITLRVVRFQIPGGGYECVITNLPQKDFPCEKLKELYAMRWGVETSFRELKYALGLRCFHSKKVGYIKQEIYVRLLLYNFCELLTTNVVVKQGRTKHSYQVNYTLAIHICREFLKRGEDTPLPDVEALLRKNVLPVRPGRTSPRKVRPRVSVSFLYRMT